jgi:hypothetical protein
MSGRPKFFVEKFWRPRLRRVIIPRLALVKAAG